MTEEYKVKYKAAADFYGRLIPDNFGGVYGRSKTDPLIR